MLNVISHWENANQNHNDMPHFTHEHSYNQNIHKVASVDEDAV
jgi:hypothetical protein